MIFGNLGKPNLLLLPVNMVPPSHTRTMYLTWIIEIIKTLQYFFYNCFFEITFQTAVSNVWQFMSILYISQEFYKLCSHCGYLQKTMYYIILATLKTSAYTDKNKCEEIQIYAHRNQVSCTFC